MKAVRLIIMSLAMMGSTAMAQYQGSIQDQGQFQGQYQGQFQGQEGWGRGRQLDRVSVDLGMNGMEYSGSRKIHLRQLLKERNPWLQTRDFRLENVTIWAKSRHGQGMMKLVIDGRTLHQSGVPGDEYNYFRNESNTYFPIQMNNHSYVQDTTWVLQTEGNVRILKMRFNLVEERGGGRPGPVAPQVVQIAKGKLDKLIEDRDGHSVRVNDVQEIRIVALDRTFLVREVRVEFANGSSVQRSYNTELKRGRDLRIPLQRADIRHIEVTGTSLDLIGSRAQYIIEAVIQQRRY